MFPDAVRENPPHPFSLDACSVMKDICLCSHCYINIPKGLFFLLARIIAVFLRKFAELPVAQMSHSSVVLPCSGWRCLACSTSSWQLWTFSCIPALTVLSHSLIFLTRLFKPAQCDKAFHSLEWLHWADKWIVHLCVTKACRRLWALLCARRVEAVLHWGCDLRSRVLSCAALCTFAAARIKTWGLPVSVERTGRAGGPGSPVLLGEWQDKDGLLCPAVPAMHPAWLFHQSPAKQQLWLSPHTHGRKEGPLCSQQPSGLNKSLPCLPPGLISLPALQTTRKGSRFWNCPDFAVSIFGNTNWEMFIVIWKFLNIWNARNSPLSDGRIECPKIWELHLGLVPPCPRCRGTACSGALQEQHFCNQHTMKRWLSLERL